MLIVAIKENLKIQNSRSRVKPLFYIKYNLNILLTPKMLKLVSYSLKLFIIFRDIIL